MEVSSYIVPCNRYWDNWHPNWSIILITFFSVYNILDLCILFFSFDSEFPDDASEPQLDRDVENVEDCESENRLELDSLNALIIRSEGLVVTNFPLLHPVIAV